MKILYNPGPGRISRTTHRTLTWTSSSPEPAEALALRELQLPYLERGGHQASSGRVVDACAPHESGVKVAQSCRTLGDPMDCSLPSSSVHGFSRQEYCSGLPFRPPGDLPDPGIESLSSTSPSLQADSLLLSHQGNAYFHAC